MSSHTPSSDEALAVAMPGLRALFGSGGVVFLPPVDVIEEGGDYLIEIDLPGHDPDETFVALEAGNLIVSSHRTGLDADHLVVHHVAERAHGLYQRVVPLPGPVEPSRAQLLHEHGVLTVRLPKRRHA